MSAERYFLDTNVLVYAYDNSTPAKQTVARKWLSESLRNGTGVISVQVLGEFFHVVAIRKKLLPALEAEEVVQNLSAFSVELVDGSLVRAAIALHRRFSTGYWDSLILATARRAGCGTVLSEDFNSGQDYEGVKVRNPFA